MINAETVEVTQCLNIMAKHIISEFYSKLTSRDNYIKPLPLTGCRIDKSKVCIQKRGAS